MTPVIAIFDIGKTNKKLFLFDEAYQVVYERNESFPEIKDEDGDDCENLQQLTDFIVRSFQEVCFKTVFEIVAINFSAYGASLVYLDVGGRVLTPLYNYLKKYPDQIKQKFYAAYGGEEAFSLVTASPVLGSLNSGMQILRIKQEKPEVFPSIVFALHLPQFASYLITAQFFADITSIGCHTNLWNFSRKKYHDWTRIEGVDHILAPIRPASQTLIVRQHNKNIASGIGLHDSSAALIPYLKLTDQPFLLISTGTWCISLNPFNDQPLTAEELKEDCLCYLTPEGVPVKASRIFGGHQHGQLVKKLAFHFSKANDYFEALRFDPEIFEKIKGKPKDFGEEELSLAEFATYEEAYHYFVNELAEKQYISTRLVLRNSPVQQIFVDGGFCKNDVFMNLLSFHFCGLTVYSATVAHASALGAALVIHDSWNKKNIPGDLITLKNFSKK
jgi:rhamnulokinase